MALIKNITEEMRNKIRAKSVTNLPVNPSERGLTAASLQMKFVAPIIDKQDSALSELDRVVNETNTQLTGLENKDIALEADLLILKEAIALNMLPENIKAGDNVAVSVNGKNVTINAGFNVKKVVTTAAMWSGNASPYTLTINDPIITADSWVDVYGFGSADKYILTNALDSTPIVTAGKFQIQFSSLHQGTLTIVYTVREVK